MGVPIFYIPFEENYYVGGKFNNCGHVMFMLFNHFTSCFLGRVPLIMKWGQRSGLGQRDGVK